MLFAKGTVLTELPAKGRWIENLALVSWYHRSYGDGFFGDGTLRQGAARGYWIVELTVAGEKRLAWIHTVEPPSSGISSIEFKHSVVADFGLQTDPGRPLVVGAESSARRWIDVVAWDANRRELTVGIASDIWVYPLWPQHRSVDPGGSWVDYPTADVTWTTLRDGGGAFVIRNLPESAALLRVR